MTAKDTSAKKYGEEFDARLQQLKSKLENLEARAKQTMGEAEIETLRTAKSKKREIERKLEDLRKSGDARAAQIESEIDSDLATVSKSLEQFEGRVKRAAERARLETSG